MGNTMALVTAATATEHCHRTGALRQYASSRLRRGVSIPAPGLTIQLVSRNPLQELGEHYSLRLRSDLNGDTRNLSRSVAGRACYRASVRPAKVAAARFADSSPYRLTCQAVGCRSAQTFVTSIVNYLRAV